MHAQRVLEHVSKSSQCHAENARAIDEVLVRHRAKRLVNNMLRHSYRPLSGRMFHRCVRCVVEFQGNKKNEANKE